MKKILSGIHYCTGESGAAKNCVRSQFPTFL